jgi:metal-sulfur cluster biosynthetic enzyme
MPNAIRASEGVRSEAPLADLYRPRNHEGDASMVERLWNALREVNDPELPISVVDLGLIYDIRFENGTAEVELTYTATGCPCTEFIRWDVAERLQRETGVEDIRLREVWSPPWTTDRISPEGADKLRKLGVTL